MLARFDFRKPGHGDGQGQETQELLYFLLLAINAFGAHADSSPLDLAKMARETAYSNSLTERQASVKRPGAGTGVLRFAAGWKRVYSTPLVDGTPAMRGSGSTA